MSDARITELEQERSRLRSLVESLEEVKAALLAENVTLREELEHDERLLTALGELPTTTGYVRRVLSDLTPLTAAEVVRVERLEAVAEAAREVLDGTRANCRPAYPDCIYGDDDLPCGMTDYCAALGALEADHGE